MKKRVLSLILVFALVLSLCGSAFAAQSSAEEITLTLPTITNPLYANLSAEDIPVQQNTQKSHLKLSATPCTSIKEAGALVRSAMLQHVETIEYSIISDASVSAQDISNSVLEEAFVHTGSPKEGDYLRWQYYLCQPSCSYFPGSDTVTYNFTCDISYLTTLEQENELDSAAAALLEQLQLDGKSDYDKISAIYSYICDNVSYDNDTLYTDSYILKYSAYAALINKTAVCQGYAALLYMLLLSEGIDCRIITSTNHAWNIVELGGIYYNLDCTYDAGFSTYSYFLFGDDTYSDSDHTREAPYNVDPFVSYYPTSCTNYSGSPTGQHTHDYTDTVVASTCETAGYTLHTCSCGISFKDSVTAATGHRLANDACVYCGRKSTPSESDVYAAMIALKDKYPEGMSWTEAKRYAWNGDNTTGSGCVAFSFILSDAAFGYLPAHKYYDVSLARVGDILRINGHNVIILEVHADHFIVAEGNYNSSVHWGRSITRAAAESGLEHAYTRYQMTNDTSGELHTHDYAETVIAPTCTENGYTTHSCDCGESYIDSYVDALGHDTELRDKRSATCTRDGYTGDATCKVCNRIVNGGSTIPALGHDYVDGVCTRCRTADPDYQPSHSHSYTDIITAPTCTDKGYTTHSCDCGESYVDSYLAALGHSYANGVCTRCGADDPNYKEPTPAVSFTDVPDGAYYAKPVAWAVSESITGGYNDGTFRPMAICTRAQIVTFIWRANGSPEPLGTAKGFTDVADGTYYYKAVLWAAEQGITGGFNDGGFHPNELVTRAQAMTFLWRANNMPTVPTGTVNTFKDVPETAYYHDAVLWAVANGITGGYDSTQFGSMDGCTRAQIVTFLYRSMA